MWSDLDVMETRLRWQRLEYGLVIWPECLSVNYQDSVYLAGLQIHIHHMVQDIGGEM